MDTQHLEEYVELSRRLNFTATARFLNLSQPTLSHHIRSLEREVGAQLIERSVPGGTARLTQAGQLFLDVAKDVLARVAEGAEKIRDLERRVSGRIAVRTPRNESSAPLLSYIFEYRTSHPFVEVVLLPWTDVDGVEDVASGNVDFAYIACPDPDDEGFVGPGVACATYSSAPIFVWVDKSDPLADGRAITPKDLDGRVFPIPANQKRNSWSTLVREFCKNHGVELVVDERYCDSVEDFILSKVGSDDFCVFIEGWRNTVSWRSDRVSVGFDPVVRIDQAVAYRADSGNPAVESFARFLRGKYASNLAGAVE